MEHVKIIGDYVLTKCENVFNRKYSYWLSKKGMTISMYCFSTETHQEYLEMEKNIDSYINYFQKRYEKESYHPFRKPLAHLIYMIEKMRGCKMGSHEIRHIGLAISTYDSLKKEYDHLKGEED